MVEGKPTNVELPPVEGGEEEKTVVTLERPAPVLPDQAEKEGSTPEPKPTQEEKVLEFAEPQPEIKEEPPLENKNHTELLDRQTGSLSDANKLAEEIANLQEKSS